jgi:DNA topoisomerase-1
MKFPGFLAAWDWAKKKDEVEEEEEAEEGAPLKDERGERELPAIVEGEALKYLGGQPEQHFTQPPARYSDASLVKALEELGIGRPSTYASTISNILDRTYVERIEGGRLKPSELGRLVNELLVKHFHGILNVQFTAQMEEQLDLVEEGKLGWREAVASFYSPFAVELEAAKGAVVDVRKTLEKATDVVCEKCGAPMVVKWGRLGKFLACTAYPGCKSTKPMVEAADGTVRAAVVEAVDVACPKCGKPMAVKQGRFGSFLACTGYPECKSTKPLNKGIGVHCPKCADGQVVMKRSKKGRNFFSCDQYPACDFVSWGKPVNKPCPACGAKFLVEKVLKSGAHLGCATEGCGHKEAMTSA